MGFILSSFEQTSVGFCWRNSGGTSWLLVLSDIDITRAGCFENNSDPPSDLRLFDFEFLLFWYFFSCTQYLPATSNEHQMVISAVRKITLLLITRPRKYINQICLWANQTKRSWIIYFLEYYYHITL